MNVATPTPQWICTAEELRQITGRKRAAAQRRWLDRYQWRYAVNAVGAVIVARSHAEAKLNPPPITHQITHNAGQDTPDWSAFDGT